MQGQGGPALPPSNDLKNEQMSKFQMFFNPDFLNLPEIPKLNKTAEILNEEVENSKKKETWPASPKSAPHAYFGQPGENKRTSENSSKQLSKGAEAEVPLYQDFKLPEFKKSMKRKNCSMEFRTPKPRCRERFFTNQFTSGKNKGKARGVRHMNSCVKGYHNKHTFAGLASQSESFKDSQQCKNHTTQGSQNETAQETRENLKFSKFLDFELGESGKLIQQTLLYSLII